MTISFLKRKAREWALLVVKLHNTPVPPALEGQKQTLLNFARRIKTSVENITGPLDALSPLNQLGIIPVLIGGAAIGGVIAAITKWTLDYRRFMAKLAEQRLLIEQGVSPAEAANIVNQSDKRISLFGSLNKPLLIGALVLGGAWLYSRKRS